MSETEGGHGDFTRRDFVARSNGRLGAAGLHRGGLRQESPATGPDQSGRSGQAARHSSTPIPE